MVPVTGALWNPGSELELRALTGVVAGVGPRRHRAVDKPPEPTPRPGWAQALVLDALQASTEPLSVMEILSHGSDSSPLRQLRTKTLSVREIEVVQLVAEGLSNDAIAKRLFLSPRTVQSHVANAMSKSGSANRTELGVLAVREGLVPIAETVTREQQ